VSDVRLIRHYALFYEYVTENLIELRAPHRPLHLALIAEWTADGRVLHGGALGDPPHGALIVFAVDDPAEVEAFAGQDPYVAAGIVTSWRVEPWNVVARN